MESVSSSPAVNPFKDGKYTGSITIQIFQSTKSLALFIRVIGERLQLETFQGKYMDPLREFFGEKVIEKRDDFQDLKEIFGDAETMKNYLGSQPESDEQIEKRIERDASRPFQGNMFTGFAIVRKEDGKILGRMGLGSGRAKGDSEMELIIHKDERNQRYALEAACLVGALAQTFFGEKYKVPVGDDNIPVERFTATTRNDNQQMLDLFAKFGLTKIRDLSNEESQQPRSLYGVEGSQLKKELEKWVNIENLFIVHCTMFRSPLFL